MVPYWNERPNTLQDIHHIRYFEVHTIPNKILVKATSISVLLAGILANPDEKPAGCPNIYVFGARETTAPPSHGSAVTFVNLIWNTHSGATSQAIDYPAAGGRNALYASSIPNGTRISANLKSRQIRIRYQKWILQKRLNIVLTRCQLQEAANQVNTFNRRCPATEVTTSAHHTTTAKH